MAKQVERHDLPPGRHVKPLDYELPTEDPDRAKHVGRMKAAARYNVVDAKTEHEQRNAQEIGRPPADKSSRL